MRMQPSRFKKIAFHLLAGFAFLASANGATSIYGWDWPVSRGNGEGTAVSDQKLPAEPKVVWEFKTGNSQAGFEATPIIAEGKVLIGDFDGNFYAIDLQSGDVIWKQKAGDGIVAAAAYSNGKVVVGDFNSKVYCYDVSDGKLVWEHELDQPIVSGASFFGDEALVSSDAGALHALSMKDGSEKWMYETGDQLRSTASIWKELALLGGCDSKLHRIDVRKGTAASEGTPLQAPTLSTPNVIGNIAIVPTQPGNVFAINAESGEVIWNYQPEGGANADIRGSAAVQASWSDGKLEGIVVVPSRNRRLIGLNATDGKMLWETVLKKRADGSPVICDGRAWIGGSDGMVYAVDLKNGQQTWSYQLSGQILASPAVASNRLVVATEKGAIVCFGE